MSAFFWALLTAGIWGLVPLMEKVGLRAVPPEIGVFVRSLGVMAGLVVFSCLWSPWAVVRTLSWSSLMLLMTGGFLASFLGQWAFYHALKLGAVSQITPVAGAYPLIAAMLGWCVLREPITLPRLFGVVLVVFGVVLLRK